MTLSTLLAHGVVHTSYEYFNEFSFEGRTWEFKKSLGTVYKRVVSEDEAASYVLHDRAFKLLLLKRKVRLSGVVTPEDFEALVTLVM